jgi:hypothetical protein
VKEMVKEKEKEKEKEKKKKEKGSCLGACGRLVVTEGGLTPLQQFTDRDWETRWAGPTLAPLLYSPILSSSFPTLS